MNRMIFGPGVDASMCTVQSLGSVASGRKIPSHGWCAGQCHRMGPRLDRIRSPRGVTSLGSASGPDRGTEADAPSGQQRMDQNLLMSAQPITQRNQPPGLFCGGHGTACMRAVPEAISKNMAILDELTPKGSARQFRQTLWYAVVLGVHTGLRPGAPHPSPFRVRGTPLACDGASVRGDAWTHVVDLGRSMSVATPTGVLAVTAGGAPGVAERRTPEVGHRRIACGTYGSPC